MGLKRNRRRIEWGAMNTTTTRQMGTAAVLDFAHDVGSNTALQIRMKTTPTQTFFTNKLEVPGGFAGVMMTTLFSGADAATQMLSDNFSATEKGTILASMKSISVKELGLGWWAFPNTIMNAIVDDTKKLGGDDSYQIDIGI